jgi:hypothetical protein
VTRKQDDKVLYHNAFITDHAITAETVPKWSVLAEVVGRRKMKITMSSKPGLSSGT